MKVALYEIRASEARYKYVKEVTEWTEEDKGYLRVSDIVDVAFIEVEDAIIIPQKVAALRAEKVQVAQEFEDKIAKLQAITHQPEKGDNVESFK